MASTTTVAQAVLDTLKDHLPDVDQASLTSFMPALRTSRVAIMGVSQGHVDEGYVYGPGYVHVVHRLRFLFWVKLIQGREEEYHLRARNLGREAMHALVANEQASGYTLADSGDGVAMTYSVDPNIISEGGQPYLVGTFSVPVMQKETV
ncbi:MAG: hypothetical protein ACOYD4_06895 [Solirubrobacterales bacterium]